jgi:hypothetical protein
VRRDAHHGETGTRQANVNSFQWLVVVIATCTACVADPSALIVGVVFHNSWRLGGEAPTASEQALIKHTMLQTLGDAYDGFGVRFVEDESVDRLIRVEDTPYGRMAAGHSARSG